MDRRRTIDERAADREVARALRARGGAATVADVVVATALPEQAVQRSLERLLDGYDGSVGVAKGGALIYRFRVGPLGLKPRRERRVLLRAAIHALAAFTSGAVAAMRAVFRAVVAIQLLVYLLILLAPVSVVIGVVVGVGLFVILLVGAISDGDLGGALDMLFDPTFIAIVLAGCIVYGTYLVFKRNADVLMALAGKNEKGKKGVAGFIAQVNDFALGPETPPPMAERIDRAWPVSQADERIVLERVRGEGGRLRAGDLVAWLGLDLDGADRQAGRICVEYDGEPSAADIDVVEFELRSLMVTVAAPSAPAASAKTSYERGRPAPRLTANTPREDAAIAGFALVNAVAGAIGWHVFAARVGQGGWWRFAEIAGGMVPVGFSALLLGLLVARVPGVLVRGLLHRRRRRRAALHDAMVDGARKRRPVDLDALARTAGAERAEARAAAVRLGGSFDLDAEKDPQKTVWRFARLERELARKPRGEAVRAVAEMEDGGGAA